MAMSMARSSIVSRMFVFAMVGAATAAEPAAAQTGAHATVDNDQKFDHSAPHTAPNAMTGNGWATQFTSAWLFAEGREVFRF